MLHPHALGEVWVANQGAACTTASILAGLGALGARDLPDLAAATLALGAREPYGAPALLDYVSLPRRRAPLDVRVEALAAAAGLGVRCRSGLVARGRRVRPAPGEALVVNLAWGQEAPGVAGTWGWHPLRPATYQTGGHSVLLAAVEGREWLVLDPNHRGLQRWSSPGLAVTVTRIRTA
ncbi:MAG TPA: hypothetical protein VOB72_17155 [Candidatus Dormibacteraeota bacterium]|nr:hypothetical protein [Candidatus Dormibacteraeota bacterium]